MTRYFSCPEDQLIDDSLIDSGYLRCGTSASFEEFTHSFDLFNLLSSLSSFDSSTVSLYVGYYLAMFVVGFSSGMVIRLMKKA